MQPPLSFSFIFFPPTKPQCFYPAEEVPFYPTPRPRSHTTNNKYGQKRMGWFSNSPSDPSGEDDNGGGQSTDTFGHLRPEVREFLEREAPIKPSARQVPAPGSTFTRELETEGELAGQEKREFDPTVYSKYGKKYADIWAQYRPPATIEAEYRTPSTAINDVYQSYRDRKSAIGAAAMENCVFQQLALQDCYSSGGKLAKLTACTAENDALQDCFKSQQVCSPFRVGFVLFGLVSGVERIEVK